MHPPIKDEQKKDFTDRLFVTECTLLKVVDFKLDLDINAQHREYVRRYTKNLYDSFLGPMADNLVKFGEAVANDSYYTLANIIFPVQTVALSCVLIASGRYGHPIPNGKNA